jgi:16S rRNA G1207 methylase RsmC
VESLEEQRRREEEARLASIRDLEAKVRFLGIPGFFPTPPATVGLMMGRLRLEEGQRVLEPSAGKGDLAEAVAARGGRVYCVEVNRDLCCILQAKGLDHSFRDFLEYRPGGGADFDRIIMNPPFEDGQDMVHVRHAFNFLRPGGVLVALLGAGCTFRQDGRAAAFRDWVDDQGGTLEELPEGAFKGMEAFRETGARAVMLTMER